MSFGLLGERVPERLRAWLDLSGRSITLMYVWLALIIFSGIVNGFLGRWWGDAWIWAGIALLLAVVGAMYFLASGPYSRVRRALGMDYMVGGKRREAESPRPVEEVDALLTNQRPWLLTLVGFGGLAVITMIMLFKPF